MPTPLSEALTLYRKGDFDGATRSYQQILNENPASSEAYAGLTRVYLKKKDVQQASDTIHKGLEKADAPSLHVALGELLFRQGKIGEAENEWVRAIKSGAPDPRAYLGLARVRFAIAMYKTGRDMIDRAYALDPSDPEIRRLWAAKLDRAEYMKFLENYLRSENNNDDAETRDRMKRYLEYLKARASDSHGRCQLVSKIASTETTLVRLMSDPNHIRGYGLEVGVNRERSQLLLDTGASGILINRKVAERAGIIQLADADFGGIGDQGLEKGYVGLAKSLKIGNLEFQNCEVRVLDRRSVVGEDGLVGSDIFSSFLVDIDFPQEKLRLTELPVRPGENSSTIELQTGKAGPDTASQAEQSNSSNASSADTSDTGAKDRYIAPEMQSYSRMFRFGHLLLIPTYLGEEGPSPNLFVLDTGMFDNQITPAAASAVTHVHGGTGMKVRGISGAVKDVYAANQVLLRFGHIQQRRWELVTFDVTRQSDQIGTEISGFLGFQMLRLLDIKIDYRDGLVDFSYDTSRFAH